MEYWLVPHSNPTWSPPEITMAVIPPSICYAGIGSRETPPDVLMTMERFGLMMARRGHTLRTGAAPGADQAFMRGCTSGHGRMELFLPWASFEAPAVQLARGPNTMVYLYPPEWAYEHAFRFHPAPHRLSQGARSLMARNSCQILGWDSQKISTIICCWTKDGGPSGGTGQALRIGNAHKVLTFNLQKTHDRASVEDLLRKEGL